MMFVHRVTQPEAFGVPGVIEFFIKAAVACKLPHPEAVPRFLARMVQMENVGLFVSQDDTGLQGMALIMLPDSPFMVKPQFGMAYSIEPGAVRPCVEASLDFARANGYNEAWGMNTTGVPDKVMQRVFSYVGSAKPIGSILEYKF
jgi:hypothetical protein